MTWKCSNENCFRDTTCALGHLDRTHCAHWQQQDVEGDQVTMPAETPTSNVPWNGYALGTSDLPILSGRGQPILIGLIGSPDSGKTSLLAFVYMWLLKRGCLGSWDFAGSWTIGGWESVVQHCRWTGDPPPSFPPHTSSTGRHPGLLHVTFRHREFGVLRDVLFTDAPGEWFTHWARAPADPVVAGAGWVVNHANALLLLVDTAALADAKKLPQARRDTRDLMERVGAEKGECPVIVVWTKDDVDVAVAVRESVSRTLGQFLPHAISERTSIMRPETIERCFTEAIRVASIDNITINAIEPRLSKDPFLAFRGLHVRA